MFEGNPAVLAARQVEAVERAQKHWRQRHQAGIGEAARPAGLTIAITREAGCPGTAVAREVGARLGWPVYDHELLERIAQEMGLRVSLLKSLDERRQSWLLEGMNALSSGVTVTEGGYVHHLSQTLLSLGAHGECVIVGRGAAQVLPAESTLRVRVIGNLADRVLATTKRLDLSRAEAEKWVHETDHQRSSFIKTHFYKDPADLRQYDMVLNTSRWSASACADLIVRGVQSLKEEAMRA